MSEVVVRPWGTYEVLVDDPEYKVKRITVNSGQRLSYQHHDRREESWTVVKGVGDVVLNEVLNLEVRIGSTVQIQRGQRHRISARDEEVVFIEVQTGDYFGEDDIYRHEDDYGRASQT